MSDYMNQENEGKFLTMKSRSRAQKLAMIGALVVFLASLVVLRRPGLIPIAIGVFAYLALLLAFWPRRRPAPIIPLPNGVKRSDFNLAIERLQIGAARLRAAIPNAPPADEPLFARMADLLDQIQAHHVANPTHVTLTRTFIRHTLVRIIETVGEYIDLNGRAGPDQTERLAEISGAFDGFVPVLEKIDQACLDNDLTQLEINVEVLNEQLDRRH